ncbi:hypothetical protein WJX72_005741 [[Myrmecia] bisecta]|uniref:Auxin efflux carrier n=1 Tax=[Myrmecia] bisecta TaxID=41462 RepID=A0AAW1PFH1_9CHLO
MQLFSVGLLVASALPVIKICIMCCVGVLLARRGILNQAGRQNLSLLVFLVFVPGLTFTKLGSAVSFSNLRLWWPLPLNVFLSLGFGSGLGWLCGRLLKAPKWFRTHITLAVGCGNVGNIPLVLVATMCSDPHMPFHDSLQADCQEIGIAYVAFGMWVAMLFQFSLAYSLLKRPEAPALDGHGELSSSPQRPIPQRSMEAGSTSMRGWASRVQRAGDCWTNSLLASRLYALVQPVLNMPTLSAAAGLVIGCTPWLKALFFGDNAPLAVFTDSADMFGQAMIPSILLVLGAVLCKGPGQGKLPVGLVVGVVVMRLIIIPALGLAAVVGLWRLGLFTAPDKLFLLVMLIVNSTPTAINLQTVATMHSNGEAEMSVLLFWQYLACIFTMPLLISIYLWAVS